MGYCIANALELIVRFGRQKSTPGGQGGLVLSDKGAPELGQLQHVQLEVVGKKLGGVDDWKASAGSRFGAFFDVR